MTLPYVRSVRQTDWWRDCVLHVAFLTPCFDQASRHGRQQRRLSRLCWWEQLCVLGVCTKQFFCFHKAILRWEAILSQVSAEKDFVLPSYKEPHPEQYTIPAPEPPTDADCRLTLLRALSPSFRTKGLQSSFCRMSGTTELLRYQQVRQRLLR